MKHRHALPMPPMTGGEPCTTSYGFFPDTYAPHDPEVLAAEAMCRRCPLVRACFIWALAHPSLTADGIWGATTPWQRRELRRRLLHRLGAGEMLRTLRAEYARAVASEGIIRRDHWSGHHEERHDAPAGRRSGPRVPGR